MSEYQYHEFMAIERPLGEAERAQLRRLSSQAEITSTSFVDEYNWGDFKGDSKKLMAKWFDLHLYRASWGTSRFMVRLPKRFVSRAHVDVFLECSEIATLIDAGDYVILDVYQDDEGGWHEDQDGVGQLSPLLPLRNDLLFGDLRMLYLIWLVAVADGSLREDVLEPLPGIAPLNGALSALARFLLLDSDLVQAAAERCADDTNFETPSEQAYQVLSAIPDHEKTALLVRFYEGDPYASIELRKQVQELASSKSETMPVKKRTVLELRKRAAGIRKEREHAEATRKQAKRKK